LVARLRPTDCNDRFELLYWSLWKNQWAPAGPFGRTVLSIDDALRFIAPGGYLLVYDVTARQMELRKVELSGRDGDDAGQRNPPSFEPATMPRSSD
jgi:hypothetical protein